MMYKIIKEKHMFTKTLVIVSICITILVFGEYTAEGITSGLLLCTQILIPSLFPFMILANLAVKSGISDYLGKYLGKITEGMFGVSGKCGAVILLSVIGGYPVGAKGISALYKEGKISEKDAVKLSYSLVCAGPGFLMTYIGTCTLNSANIGICLLISQIISVVIIGFINKLINIKDEKLSNNDNLNMNTIPLSNALVESVRECTYSMLELCGTVTLISAFLAIFQMKLYNYPLVFRYIAILLEVTTASNILSSDYNILLLAFAVGFGGLSIHFQIFQALKNIPLNKLVFIAFRLLQGAITTTFTYIFMKTFDISIPTYSSIATPDFTLSTSVIGSILLIFLGICFLNNLKNNRI